jgi:16S rRNA U516 pseudouridylate synthase RsuA-like enzyme
MEPNVKPQPTFPVRINKYLAWKQNIGRRQADELIKEGKIFINKRLAVLGDKVTETDVIEFRFSGKQPKSQTKS